MDGSAIQRYQYLDAGRCVEMESSLLLNSVRIRTLSIMMVVILSVKLRMGGLVIQQFPCHFAFLFAEMEFRFEGRNAMTDFLEREVVWRTVRGQREAGFVLVEVLLHRQSARVFLDMGSRWTRRFVMREM
jgi:hypothetical protein